MTTPLRLADLMAGLSLASDLGFALRPGEAMRRCALATALARRLDLPEADVADVYWTALLQHIGCTGFAHEEAEIFGDEMAVNAAVARMDPNDVRQALAFLREATAGRPLPSRIRAGAHAIVRGNAFGRRFAAATCEVGRETARRLGLGEGVRRGLQDVVEDWSGKAGARGLRGEAISLPARVTAVASTAAMAADAGDEALVGLLRARAGGMLDPALVDAFVEHRGEILEEAADRDAFEAVLAAEPEPVRQVAADGLANVAAAIGDVGDLKSPWFGGHSRRVAALAVGAAERVGLAPDRRAGLEVAALLHDIGRVGISNAVWERPRALTRAEWEQVRLHPYHTERILAASPALAPLARVAGMHHERLDGSGYHRGSSGGEIGIEARLLAAADAFEALTHDRPYRGALSPEAAAERLAEEDVAGRLAADAVDAVLEVGGIASVRHPRPGRPAGLSEREIEVLQLLARGLSNREIAGRLAISRRTAEHHVQHIYDKLGASSRAAAALFAMEHALLE